MRTRVFALMIIAIWIGVSAGPTFACDGAWPNDIRRPKEMISRSDLILRVTAVAYSVPPAAGATSSSSAASLPGVFSPSRQPKSKVRFSVEEVVKGRYSEREIVLPGILTTVDEWNSGEPPYVYPRHSADFSCYTYSYRTGASFLLVLKKDGKEFAIDWSPSAPVNEQLRSSDDGWIRWVRSQVKPSQLPNTPQPASGEPRFRNSQK